MKKSTLILIIALVAVLLLSACTPASQEPDDKETSGSGTDNDGSTSITSVSDDPGFAPVNLNGYTFKILTHDTEQFEAEKLGGGVINDAVFTRNIALEEKFSISITSIEVAENKYKGAVETAVTSGQIVYDLLTPGISYACQLASEGYLMELHDVPNLHLDSSYWWKNVLEDSSVGGMNYFAVSDLNSRSFPMVNQVMFNKDIAKHYSMESFYDIVKEGKWTLDVFIDFSSCVYEDNGNQKVDENDTFGMTGNSYMVDSFIYGFDMLFVPKDDNDIPYMDFIGNETFYNAFNKLLRLFDEQSTLYGEDYNATIESGRLVVPQAAFAEGRALFWVDSMGWIPSLRYTELNFGLLPIPKMNAEQEKYSSCLHAWTSSSCAIPKNCEENIENIGMIIDEMSYLSKQIVRPAYYDLFLEGQMARDVESTEMIPLIIDNCRIDIAMVYRVPGFTFVDDLRALTKNSSMSVATKLTRTKQTYQNNLDRITESLINNEK